MRVKIGNYPQYFGPWQLAQLILFWERRKRDRFGILTSSDRVKRLGHWLSRCSLVSRPLRWIDDRRKQTVRVRIDRWDTWSLDWTLSKIIAPALRQLKATQQGAGFVEDVDVPDELRSTSAPRPEDGGVDANHFKRWEWALNEMIWAMENIDQHDDDREAQERIANGCRLFGKYFTNLWD